ncbi:unnamed protein product [Enterobius vermicularis]|uniref:Transmembrane protein n=1 Tax=Enterobius vermicularis TaxID=51028 RepID=A0A0N4VP25_ENTVE|nr:unnamed protein product [Enterobius vermicularis]
MNGNLELMKKLIKEPYFDSTEEMANDDSRNYMNQASSGAPWSDDYDLQGSRFAKDDGESCEYIKQTKIPENSEASSDNDNNPAIIYSIKTVTEYVKANKERVFLYAALGLSTGLVLLLAACVFVQCRSKQKITKKQHTAPSSTTEYDSLLCDKTQTSPIEIAGFSICVNPETHNCFDMGDLTHNGKSFMRFAQLTPPRVPQNLHCYS